jgi:vacuolar-type H+-ATPase subunit F/Vma7
MITTPELAQGFALAGAEVSVALSAGEAAAALDRLAVDPEVGVIGVHAPFLAAFEPDRRHRYEDSVAPVVVGVPAGTAQGTTGGHRARLAGILQRAIGFRISFSGDEDQ